MDVQIIKLIKMELTLEKAKELSERKWQIIVNNEGYIKDAITEEGDCIDGIINFIPELKGMRNECAMCEYIIEQNDNSCNTCLYTWVCNKEYSDYINLRCTNTALNVLNAIKKCNDRHSKIIKTSTEGE